MGFVPAENLIGRADRIMSPPPDGRCCSSGHAVRPVLQGDRVKISAELKAFEARSATASGRRTLVRALTHASLSSPTRPSNERLEFLGDRVLNLAMAEALAAADPDAAEGRLAPRLNALVRLETCADVARGIGLATC